MKKNKNADELKNFDTLYELGDNIRMIESIKFEIDDELISIEKYYQKLLTKILKANGEDVKVYANSQLDEDYYSLVEVACSFEKTISSLCVDAIEEYFYKNPKSGIDIWFFIDVYPNKAIIQVDLERLPDYI